MYSVPSLGVVHGTADVLWLNGKAFGQTLNWP